MSKLQEAAVELAELVGEDMAIDLIAELADGIKSGRVPFDEVGRFMLADAKARGDEEAVKRARFTALWHKNVPTSEPIPGRPSKVEMFMNLYQSAQDKAEVLRLAQQQMGRTSYWRLRKELGLSD